MVKFWNKKSDTDNRIKYLSFVFMGIAFIIVLKLFNLQILQYSFYAALASDQHEIYKKLFPDRGQILIKNKIQYLGQENDDYYPLALNKEYFLIFAQPKDIKDPENVSNILEPILEIPKNELLSKLSLKDDPYEPLKKKVSKETVDKIKNLSIKGIGYTTEMYRYYPENNIGSNVLGFLGFKDEQKIGLYGIEGYFNEDLSGTPGILHSEIDLLGRIIEKKEFNEAVNGSDIVLTLDKTIQFQACNLLNSESERLQVKSGAIIVMEPKTGKIIAMCSYPDFNPNEYNIVESVEVYNNNAIHSAYEPGSIFKPITMAIGLDLNKITPETTYVDTGKAVYGQYTIQNADLEAHGTQTMTEVLENSLNTGTIFVAEKVGRSNFKRYVQNFGFDDKTGIKLDSEIYNNIKSLNSRAEIDLATASFGQGLTVTPIQMLKAINAIANNGKLMKPYIVEKIMKANGEIIEYGPQEINQVISTRAANLLTGMMVKVIETGQGARAEVPGYYLAGKTGTAQIPDNEKGGYSEKTNHSFVGFGPADDPQFSIIIRLEDPKVGSYSSTTAAPIFGKLADFILKYYQIPPNK